MIVTFKPSQKSEIELIDPFFQEPPQGWTIRVKIAKFPIGFYVARPIGVKTVQIESFIVREDYRRLRYGTEMMDHLVSQVFNTDWIRVIVPETVDVGVCLFLQKCQFKGRLVGTNYHFHRRIG